jgi:uncharacterized protein involved in cysteine biosynthesis
MANRVAAPVRASLVICHICPAPLLNQQLLIVSFLSFVAYLTGIDFLDLSPEGSLFHQDLFTWLHPAFTSFKVDLLKIN